MNANQASEEWRPVLGYESRYEVSNLGRVRSFWGPTPRLLHPTLAGRDPYPHVTLCAPGRKPTKRRVHVLIAEAWFGVRPPQLQVRHLDDVPANTTLNNLAYGTQSDNMADRVRNGHQTNQCQSLTECLRGHPFDSENTRLYRGKRVCRACERDRARARYRATHI